MNSVKRKTVILAKKIIPFSVRFFLRKINRMLKYFFVSLGKSGKNKVYCPIANREFKTFIKLGSNLITPSNGARNRQRLVWLYLTKELNILNRPFKILHIAPEISYFEILKHQKNIEYFPGDKMADGYSNQKGVNKIDITALDCESNYFDLIICNHVLEHIPDDSKAISEMFRVLKDGGKAVVTVPMDEKLEKTFEDPNIISPAERKKYFGQWDHLRRYALDVKQRFEKEGFNTQLIRYAVHFSQQEFEKMGLSNDFIIVGEKKCNEIPPFSRNDDAHSAAPSLATLNRTCHPEWSEAK